MKKSILIESIFAVTIIFLSTLPSVVCVQSSISLVLEHKSNYIEKIKNIDVKKSSWYPGFYLVLYLQLLLAILNEAGNHWFIGYFIIVFLSLIQAIIEYTFFWWLIGILDYFLHGEWSPGAYFGAFLVEFIENLLEFLDEYGIIFNWLQK